MIRTLLCLALILAGTTSGAAAQDWATKMFESTNYDFGSVARGAKVEHRFVLKNLYVEDVHITGVRSSCGCTQPTIEGGKDTLKTYETTAIVASFNTRDFLGHKNATITVSFDKPYHGQVQLTVGGYIRSDIVLNPPGIDFGTIDEGEAAERQLAISYAGRGDWQITGVKPASPYIQAEVRETSRNSSQVGYELTVKLLPGAPAGYLKQPLLLTTNDRRATEFPVDIEGRITAELAAKPASLYLGALQPGQQVTKQVVVQGKRPFRITGVECSDHGFHYQLPETAKPVHLVPITFTAGSTPGRISYKVVIGTDLDGRTCEIGAHGTVVDATASAGK